VGKEPNGEWSAQQGWLEEAGEKHWVTDPTWVGKGVVEEEEEEEEEEEVNKWEVPFVNYTWHKIPFFLTW
jgi:hypothetical protein